MEAAELLAPGASAEVARRLEGIARLLRRNSGRPAAAALVAAAYELNVIVEDLRGEVTPPPPPAADAFAEVADHRLRYQELFDFAPDGYIVTDAQGVIEEANHAAALLLGTLKEFLPGKPLPFFVAPKWRAALYQRLARRNVAGVEHWETVLQPPRGEPRTVALAVAPSARGDGHSAGFRWLLRDVTPSRRTEQALREERDLADGLVDTVQAAVLVVDEFGRVMRSNPFLHALSGLGQAELLDRDWCEALLPAGDRPEARVMVYRALESGTAETGALGFNVAGGARRELAWSARGLTAADGGGRAVLLGYDVTDLHEAQQRALRAERLAAIGQVIAGLAHESRNALQRSQACLSLLGMRLKGQAEALDLIGRIQKAQDDLHRLFEEVREYAAPVRLDPSTCDLAEVWREAWSDLGPPAAAELHEEPGGADRHVIVSPFHLRQVFRNLFDNAVSVSPPPARVEVRCAGDASGGVRVSVCDNGPGFAIEQRQKVFEPFFTTKVRGTGLGLAICKRIVEAHGGRIELGPQNGRGAEVIVILPRRPS